MARKGYHIPYFKLCPLNFGKVHLLFPSKPPLKIETLSSTHFWKFGRRLKPSPLYIRLYIRSSCYNFMYFLKHYTKLPWFYSQQLPSLFLIFKLGLIKRQINIPLWTYIGYKRWIKDGKTFARCYTIALNFWHEYDVNFVLLYFSSYRLIKSWHLYLKNVEKNNKAVHLRLLSAYLHQNILPWYSKKMSMYFSAYSNFSETVNIFCKLSEWIRNDTRFQQFTG